MNETQSADATGVEDLKARVAAREADLNASLDGLVNVVRSAVDWRRVVREHPVECTIGAAALGFLVSYRPDIVGKSAGRSVRSLMGIGLGNLGLGNLVQSGLARAAADLLTSPRGGAPSPPAPPTPTRVD